MNWVTFWVLRILPILRLLCTNMLTLTAGVVSLGKDDTDGLMFLYPAPIVPLGVATLLSPSGSTDDYTDLYLEGSDGCYLVLSLGQ